MSILLLVLILTISGAIKPRHKNPLVPDVINHTLQEAKDILAIDGIEIDETRIEWILTDSIEKNRIVSVSPEVGSELEKGEKLKVVVSDGVYSILDNYIGINYITAQDSLNKLNFRVKTVAKVSNATVGTVISQSLEPGTKFDASVNNDIVLEYAIEDSIILDVDLLGKDIDYAADYFEQLNYSYKLQAMPKTYFTELEIENFKAETVIRTSPELGSPYVPSSDNVITVYFYEKDFENNTEGAEE